ncbi:hypothetical protein GCM10022294_27860 [Dietzia aurantiaca]|uniref:histidine kinase n=1 Tax=Dietzia aurantiaca TaxID=983873 RepID=A0ABV9PU07_9ACTN
MAGSARFDGPEGVMVAVAPPLTEKHAVVQRLVRLQVGIGGPSRGGGTRLLGRRGQSEAAMRRFVADAGHDLRTPLTTIRGFAELHRQGAADDTDRLMRRIESEARRMGVLVEDLLTLARMDEQRPIARDRVDLLSLAADAVHDARVLAPDRTIGLEVIDGPGTPEVLGDEVRLCQVLGNLVDNALRHPPAGVPVTVRVGTEAGNALLEVADSGPGMAAEEAARALERFYRAGASRTSTTGGSGLGLAILQALVESHHGTVGDDTSPGGVRHSGCGCRAPGTDAAATTDTSCQSTASFTGVFPTVYSLY